MSVTGGIQGLHFVNTMSNAGLRAGATQAKGIIGGLGRDISKLAPFAPLAAGALILGKLGDQAHDFANEFSMAMREVQTISKAVQDDFEGIGRSIINIGANGPDDAIELAKAYYQIVSAGYDGAQGLQLLDVASRSATAGITDTKTAADGLTTILNAWGKDASEAEKVADILFKTVEKGKTTFPELAQNIATVAPMASAMGISFEEISAAVASLTKQGNTTATAMTQIRQAIIGLNDNLGDGWSKVMTFQEGVQKLRDMAGGSDTALKNMMGRVEGMNAVLALTGGKAVEAAKDLDTMSTSVGSMQKAYETMMDEADNKWSMVHNKWMRELSGIGDALKVASTGWADLLNALLTNEGDLNSAKPLVGSFQDRLAGQKMMGNNAVTSWFKAIFSSNNQIEGQLWDMYKQGQSGFSEKEGQLSSLLGIKDAKERATELKTFLEQMVSERDSDLEFMNVGPGGEAVYKSREQNWQNLILLIEDAIKKANEFDSGGGGGTENKPWTISDSLAKIEELEKKIGTGDADFEIQLKFDIEREREKINQFAEKFREKFIDTINESWDTPFNRTVGADGTNSEIKRTDKASEVISKQTENYKEQTKEITKQLVPMNRLTDAGKRQLETEYNIIDAQRTQIENQEELAKAMYDSSEVLGAISYAISEVDQDLGESIGRMADMARNAGSLLSSMSTGNITSAFASGIGILGNILGLFNNEADRESSLERTLKNINSSLERQAELLSILSGEDWFSLANEHATKLKESISDLTQELNDYGQQLAEGIFGRNIIDDIGFDTSGWSVEDWVNNLSEGNPILDELGQYDEINDLISRIIELKKELNDLQEESIFESLGFNSDDIATNLSDGIRQGLKLSEGGLGDFADSFRDQLNNAVIQSVMGGTMDAKIEAYMDKVREFSGLEEDGSMFSDEEKSQLEEFYRSLIEYSQKTADELGFLSDVSSEGYSEAQGIQRSITEETGSVIAGLGMSIRENQIHANNTMMDQLAIAEEQLEILQDIKDNTSHNFKLNSIDDRLEEMNNTLKAGLAG